MSGTEVATSGINTSRNNNVNNRTKGNGAVQQPSPSPPVSSSTNVKNTSNNNTNRNRNNNNDEVITKPTKNTNTSNVKESSSSSTSAPLPPPETISPTNQLKEILKRHPNPIAHPQQHVVVTCYIPPSKVGAVIGRQGKTILGVQRDTNARMSVGTTTSSYSYSKEDSSTPAAGDTNQKEGEAKKEDDPWTPVKISGDPIGCIQAARLLIPLVENEMDDLVLDIPIHKSRHALIIGRKGLTIAALSADHNVRIMVPKSPNSQTPIPQVGQQGEYADTINETPDHIELAKQRRKESIVQLEGQVDNVEACLCKLLNIVSPNHTDKEVTFPPMDKPPIVNLPPMIKIRSVAKKTNTIIQKKLVDTLATTKNGTTAATTTTDDANKKEESINESSSSVEQQQTANEDNSSQHSSPPVFENRLIISGRSDSVDYAVNILTKIIENAAAAKNNEANNADEKTKGSAGDGGGRGGRGGRNSGRRGRGGRGRRRGRGDYASSGRGGNSTSQPVASTHPKPISVEK